MTPGCYRPGPSRIYLHLVEDVVGHPARREVRSGQTGTPACQGASGGLARGPADDRRRPERPRRLPIDLSIPPPMDTVLRVGGSSGGNRRTNQRRR